MKIIQSKTWDRTGHHCVAIVEDGGVYYRIAIKAGQRVRLRAGFKWTNRYGYHWHCYVTVSNGTGFAGSRVILTGDQCEKNVSLKAVVDHANRIDLSKSLRRAWRETVY